jgi:hypothetical protein
VPLGLNPHHYKISENNTFPWLPMKPIIKALAGAETLASFADLYESNNPEVLALEKHWIKLYFGGPATQI